MLTRAVADGRTDRFCKLIVDRKTQHVLGAHVLGEYSAEIIQVVATAMAAKMTVVQLAELELAYPTFAEAIGIAARRIVRDLGMAGPDWTGNEVGDAVLPPITLPPSAKKIIDRSVEPFPNGRADRISR
jgi:hypothetical protein